MQVSLIELILCFIPSLLSSELGGFVTSFKATGENHRRPFKSQCYAHKVMRNVKPGNYLGTEPFTIDH